MIMNSRVVTFFVQDCRLPAFWTPLSHRSFNENYQWQVTAWNYHAWTGLIRFFGLNVAQLGDFSIAVDGDYKREALAVMPLSCCRRRDADLPLDYIKLKEFASLNSSIGWLGITASPFCTEFASRIKQKAPKATVKDLIYQAHGLKMLQVLDSSVSFPSKSDELRHYLSILVFLDARRQCDRGQLC